MNYDILIIGSGVGGMESALKLGDMGYKVLLVEKEPSVGGKMILLSKVFPTLDCASCISTPKMAATAHHPNIKVMTYSQVEKIERNQDIFRVTVNKKPTFVDQSSCTGCRQCESTCNVAVPDQYNSSMVSRRAAYIAFPQAVPKKAVIEKEGTSPCSFTCPAGIKAHGYVALARSSKYEEAFNLILESTPLVGSLGKACYAPCEQECTRKNIDGAVSVRKIKEFVAENYYKKYLHPPHTKPKKYTGKSVAIIGSGPSGLTAAYHLARKGHRVTVLEAEDEPGGMLRYAIPPYRLPRNILNRDLENVTAAGVEIKTGISIEDPVALKDDYHAVYIAAGTRGTRKLKIKGEDLQGVVTSLEFLRRVNRGNEISLEGKTVTVIGGGNVAIDSARAAARLGARKVYVQYRRSREQMPAHRREIKAAEKEGVEFLYKSSPVEFTGAGGKLTGVRSTRMELAGEDGSGRKKPVPVEGTEYILSCQLVITAVGIKPDTENWEGRLDLNNDHTVRVDPETLQSSHPGIFAGGDVVKGPSKIVDAVGQGKRAAFYMDRYLNGEKLAGIEFEPGLPVVEKERVLGRQNSYTRLAPLLPEEILPRGSSDFRETEFSFTEEEMRYSAGRCLDCGVCSECGQCIATCPAGSIDLEMREEKEEYEVGSVIVSTGFDLFPARDKPQYGYGKLKNVITGMQMDRLLAPTRPYNTILRPGDGKVPDSIAFILCTGSRDKTTGNELCSRVCCMYSIKQNQLIMGSLPLADVTVYYIDVRAFGKGYDEFYDQAQAMGANFVKGRVARIEEEENGDLILQYEDIENGGQVVQSQHDMVVLSVGVLPNLEVGELFTGEKLETDAHYYVKETGEDMSPGKTNLEGVFVAGSASGAKDIPDTILHAGSAAAQAAAHVERIRKLK